MDGGDDYVMRWTRREEFRKQAQEQACQEKRAGEEFGHAISALWIVVSRRMGNLTQGILKFIESCAY